jgi:hypothetical protein
MNVSLMTKINLIFSVFVVVVGILDFGRLAGEPFYMLLFGLNFLKIVRQLRQGVAFRSMCVKC